MEDTLVAIRKDIQTPWRLHVQAITFPPSLCDNPFLPEREMREVEDFLMALKIQVHTRQNTLCPSYELVFEGTSVPLTKGVRLFVEDLKERKCTECGRAVRKLYRGFCFICLRSKAKADLCVLNPEKCHFRFGTCREPEWGISFCYQPHALYLSFTGKWKVGLTRRSRVFERWCEQGALLGTVLGYTDSRYHVGLLEKKLGQEVALNTHWKQMLVAQLPERSVLEAQALGLRKLLEENALERIEDGERESFFHRPESISYWWVAYPGTAPLAPLPPKGLPTHPEKLLGFRGKYAFLESCILPLHQLEGARLKLQIWPNATEFD